VNKEYLRNSGSISAVLGMLIAVGLYGRAAEAEMLEFSLQDAFGREVRSQDYSGVPVFLEFGACW